MREGGAAPACKHTHSNTLNRTCACMHRLICTWWHGTRAQAHLHPYPQPHPHQCVPAWDGSHLVGVQAPVQGRPQPELLLLAQHQIIWVRWTGRTQRGWHQWTWPPCPLSGLDQRRLGQGAGLERSCGRPCVFRLDLLVPLVLLRPIIIVTTIIDITPV